MTKETQQESLFPILSLSKKAHQQSCQSDAIGDQKMIPSRSEIISYITGMFLALASIVLALFILWALLQSQAPLLFVSSLMLVLLAISQAALRLEVYALRETIRRLVQENGVTSTCQAEQCETTSSHSHTKSRRKSSILS